MPPTKLPPRKKRARSGIARGPQRVWPRHRKFVRGHVCAVPGCIASEVEFAHVRTAENSGTGIKPHDSNGVPLCRHHHREQHDCGVHTFEDRHGIDLEALAAEFVRKSTDTKMRASLAEVA